MYRIIKGDVQRFCEHYHGEPFHAAFMDAPYEMSFMNRSWDASGVSFDPKTWEGISNLLYPGGFLFVFAGTINDDLISVAMRNAGLRKFHKMLGWVNGSGFPKATRIDTQIDRDAGAKREILPDPQAARRNKRGSPLSPEHGWNNNSMSGGRTDIITAPATPIAQTWQRHRYGGQVLKPSIETVLVFQKPYEGRPVDCITSTGAGALWIDGGRIGVSDKQYATNCSGDRGHGDNRNRDMEFSMGCGHASNSGRWPPNFYLSHTPLCQPIGMQSIKNTSGSLNGNEPSKPAKNVYGEYDRHTFERYGGEDGVETVMEWACAEECPVRKLGEQSGSNKSTGGNGVTSGKTGSNMYGNYAGDRLGQNAGGLGDIGTASRYFFQSHWLYERLEQSDPVFYSGKATRKERDAGLDFLPMQTRNRVNPGGLENEPRWAPVQAKNTHPTVKPIALCKWLATLLLPPPEYAPRRLLVPFAGSGSEMIGALLAGWEEVVGVELLQENVDIARSRIAWWQSWIDMGCNDVDVILKDGIKLEQDTPPEQLTLNFQS